MTEGDAIDDLRATRRVRTALIGVALAATAYYVGSWVPAALAGGDGFDLGDALRAFYTPVCHQEGARSLTLFGGGQAVCGRCSGLYLGGVIGLWLGAASLARRPRLHPRWFFIALAPTAVDAMLGIVGLPQLGTVPRMWISLPGGLVAGLFLARGVAELARSAGRSRATRNPRLGTVEESHG